MKALRRIGLACGIAALAVTLNYLPAWAVFGEENLTLVQILAELIHAKHELEDLNEVAEAGLAVSRDLLDTYRQVNAGIEELRTYSFGEFLGDFRDDLYDQYPGLGEVADASRNLSKWT